MVRVAEGAANNVPCRVELEIVDIDQKPHQLDDGHGGAAIAELAVAMDAPFLVLFPPLWLGVLSATGLMVLGHLLMLFAIAAVMLRRRDEYT